jgi:hypothetical protein
MFDSYILVLALKIHRVRMKIDRAAPNPPPPHARRRPYMHSAKGDKRQDHRG